MKVIYPALAYCTLLLAAALLLIRPSSAAADGSLATKCSSQFTKVTNCMPFATAKADTPTKDCCDSVAALKNTDPACLCFIIQQVHNGTNKALGIQEARLLQLPAACKIANASITECPRLLNLPPNSPDAAIFNNATAAAPGIVPPAGGSGGGSSDGSSPVRAGGLRHQPEIGVSVVLAVVAAVFLVFSPAAAAT